MADELRKLKRRKDYRDDKEFAAAERKRRRSYYQQEHEFRKDRRISLIQSMTARWRHEGYDDEEIARRLEYLGARPMFPLCFQFGERSVLLYPISFLAAETGYSTSTLRSWERDETIPRPAYTLGSKQRYYSEFFIDILRESILEARKSSMWNRKTLRREFLKRWEKEVIGPYGSERNRLLTEAQRT